MIEIGNNVSITTGVTILTHGYDWSVFKGMYGDVLGSAGRVKIGDNVFIGMHSTILKGVTIGDNVVIGANSLINKDVPDNCVVVGNPDVYKRQPMRSLTASIGCASSTRWRCWTFTTFWRRVISFLRTRVASRRRPRAWASRFW